MLRWRLILGSFCVTLLAVFCWLDVQAARPGVYLIPFAVVLAALAAHELLALLRQGGHEPTAWTVYIGALLPVLASCGPIAWVEYPADCPIGRLGWLALGLASALFVVIVANVVGIGRSAGAGKLTANLAFAALSILYLGGLLGFMVQLRLLPWTENLSRGGMVAFLSLVIVVKLSDTGAYVVGNLWGKRKLAPTLSPGKTWEGLAGGLIAAVGGAMIALGPLASALVGPSSRGWLAWLGGSLLFGLLVGGAGVLGDLAESSLKRDAGVKDSSNWLPGLGGVLDLFDSLLLAAPVAYACWASGLVGG